MTLQDLSAVETHDRKIAPLDKPKFCRQQPTLCGQIVETGKVSSRIITTIPKRYAERLGIVEGLTKLECRLEDGVLVYKPYFKEGGFSA